VGVVLALYLFFVRGSPASDNTSYLSGLISKEICGWKSATPFPYYLTMDIDTQEITECCGGEIELAYSGSPFRMYGDTFIPVCSVCKNYYATRGQDNE
jgi:hypothetical protein